MGKIKNENKIISSNKNIFCIERKCICDYTNKEIENISCSHGKVVGKKSIVCEFATIDLKEIVKKTFSDEEVFEITKELVNYINHKSILNKIDKYLKICYEGRDIKSSIEHMKKICFEEYVLRNLK